MVSFPVSSGMIVVQFPRVHIRVNMINSYWRSAGVEGKGKEPSVVIHVYEVWKGEPNVKWSMLRDLCVST